MENKYIGICLKGEAKLKRNDNPIGEIRYNSFGTPMKIIGYRRQGDLDVQFLDVHGFIKYHTTYANFKKGQIRNPYDRTAHGIGFNGEGPYKTGGTAFDTKAFSIWYAIINRCYYEKNREKYPAYEKCFMCEDWMNYQKFREWFDANFYQVGTERMHIDKDILYKNNKFYSPDTCLMVPQRINMLFFSKPNATGLPTGVQATGKRYSSTYSGKQIGIFNTIEEAAIAHDKAKKEAINRVADEYKKVIPDKVYQALINWIPDYIEY